MSHPKSPKAKDDDDEINDVSQEHECIDIGGSPVLRVENIPEETLSWLVNTLNPAEKSACIQSLHTTFTKALHLFNRTFSLTQQVQSSFYFQLTHK